MKPIYRRIITGIILLLMSLKSLAISATYQFKFNYQHIGNKHPANNPKVIEANELPINGVRMPTFNTTFENPNEMSVLSYRAKALPSKIKAEYLKKFDLYGMPNGNVFVPHEWRLIYAELAKNDALTYTFVPSDEQDGYLTFVHTANCEACAASEASLFFAQAAQTANKTNALVYVNSNIPFSISHLKPNLVTYRVQKGENQINGIAYYNPNDSTFPFWKVEVGLPKEQADLANPLLNQFITLYE